MMFMSSVFVRVGVVTLVKPLVAFYLYVPLLGDPTRVPLRGYGLPLPRSLRLFTILRVL